MQASHLGIVAAILGLGMAAGGYFIGHGFVEARAGDRYVTVRGLAEKPVVATLGTWSIRHSATGSTLADVQQRIDNDTQTIRRFLSEAGFKGEDMRIQDIRVEDRAAYSYDNRQLGDTRFNINQLIELRTSDVALLERTLARKADLVRAGVVLQTGDNDATFSFTELNTVKPEMIAEATRDARAAAEQFASDSDSRITGIRRATQGYFSIQPRAGGDYAAERSPRQQVRVVTTVEFLLAD